MEPSDAIPIAEACRDPLIPRFTFMAENLTREGAAEWIERRITQWGRGEVAGFAVTDGGGDRQLVGTIGLAINQRLVSGEVFYWIAARARRKGFATRAVRLISAWAFDELALQRLELLTHPENKASQKVARAAGYVYEGTMRSHQPFKDGRMDSALFSLVRSDLDHAERSNGR